MSLIGIRRLQVSSRPSHRAAVGSVLEWGVRSLDELRDVVDETMADELACMVREKMLRILSDVADFEEVAEEFERTMTQGRVDHDARCRCRSCCNGPYQTRDVAVC